MPDFATANVGDAHTFHEHFVDDDGTATDPSAITLTITKPDASTITKTIAQLTHGATGSYEYQQTLDTPGVWSYTWASTGTVISTTPTLYLLVDVGVPVTACAAWATVEELDVCGGLPSTVTEGMKEAALRAASDLLWRWSGFRYPGLCSETVRPCSQNEALPSISEWQRDYTSEGWARGVWGSCACQASLHRACGCSTLPELRLGRTPLVAILAVKVDGVTLTPTQYRIDDWEWLVRLDGLSWPCCQDLTKSDEFDDTFSVRFVWGRVPPPAGVQACVDLAAELAKACAGGSCKLPDKVSTVARQGVTMQFVTPERLGRDAQGEIRTALRSVDLFLSSVPTGRPAVVSSPDIDAPVRRTSTS